MKDDITEKEDVMQLVDAFYGQALKDADLADIFTNHMTASIEEHLPVIYNFWDSVLLGTMTYRGNIMIKHLDLNKRIPLTEKHFNTWLQIWEDSVDHLFVGTKAEEAKQRAKAMKELMLYKVGLSNDSNFIS